MFDVINDENFHHYRVLFMNSCLLSLWQVTLTAAVRAFDFKLIRSLMMSMIICSGSEGNLSIILKYLATHNYVISSPVTIALTLPSLGSNDR